jgi:hypothetical protein
MIRNGKTRQEIFAAKVTAPCDAKVPGGQGHHTAGV